MRIRRAAYAASIAMVYAAPAVANGRYPTAQQLVEQPDDPNRLWLRSTYGMLTSADRGETWKWVCELAVGYSGDTDPAIAVTAGGNVLVALYDGVKMTTDNGCEWRVAPDLADRNTVDVSVDRDDPNRALALVSHRRSIPGSTYVYALEVWSSLDAGGSWAPIGTALDDASLGLTLDRAPSDPSRLYVTAVTIPQSGVIPQMLLFRSVDGGTSWETLPIAGLARDERPYIAAIDPGNPDVLYVRVQGPVNEGGTVESWLLYSDDAGTTFRELIRGRADLLGFTLSPDGATVLVGFGDSRAPGLQRPVDSTAMGLFRADGASLVFQKLQEGHIGCLTWTADGILVCTDQGTRGFELGVTMDRGDTLEALAERSDVEGLLECTAGTRTSDFCADSWPYTCELIGKCVPDAGVAMDAGFDDAGLIVSPSARGGCACVLGETTRSRQQGLLSVLIVLGVALRRRAIRRRRCPQASRCVRANGRRPQRLAGRA